MKLFYVSGIDGSGKTTIARALAAASVSHPPLRYFYAQHQPFLLLPFKWIARRTLMSRSDPWRDYRGYTSRKKSVSKRLWPIALVYAAIWLFDYMVVTHVRLAAYRLGTGALVVDRYYPDIAVNISETLGLSDHGFLLLLKSLERVFPRPSWSVWLDVPIEVAYSRKRDIASPEYLRERRHRYLRMSEYMRMTVLNGQGSVDDILENMSNHMQEVP